MTFEQLIQELFVNHWFFTTIFFPPLAFMYAWITDQTMWWIGSGLWWAIVTGAVRVKLRGE